VTACARPGACLGGSMTAALTLMVNRKGLKISYQVLMLRRPTLALIPLSIRLAGS
jgi:hypothetical protein